MSPPGPHDRDHKLTDPQTDIRKTVQDAIINARHRWTMRDLVREISHQETCSRNLVQSVIRSLVEAGVLEYRYTFGQTYLSLSFRRSVDLTPRFTLIPPGYAREIPPGKISVAIAQGIAFGDGGHPTTRLALQALDLFWTHWQVSVSPIALDIGTGTGILAIAAACLGAANVLALDVDACARAEARDNVRLNPKATPIVRVENRPLASIEGRFDLIMANLRLPTLAEMAAWVRNHLSNLGCMVVSGCRGEEWGRLVAIYAREGLHPLWQNAMAGWAGGLLGPQGAPSHKPAAENDRIMGEHL